MHGIGQKELAEGNEWSSVDQVCRCRSIKMIRSRPITSDQIKPNPTKKNCPAQIKAQAVRSKVARTNLEFGRAGWLRGNAEWMNGNSKGLSDRNTFITCCTDERGSELEGNLRLCSLMFAYVRLMGEKMLKGRPLKKLVEMGPWLMTQSFSLFIWGGALLNLRTMFEVLHTDAGSRERRGTLTT